MAKSKGRLLAELLASDGKVKESKSALDISGGKIAPGDIPILPNSKLENSSISIAGHSTSLGGTVSLNTGDITEHTNYKYYTEGRARGAISAASGGGHGSVAYNASTGALSVTGVSTEAIQDVVGAMFSSNTESGITVTYVDGDGTIDLSVAALNTGNVSEGSNLYHTTARARAAISATGSLSYNSTTGVISFTMPAQNTSNITEGSNLYFTNARADARIVNAGSANWNTAYTVANAALPKAGGTLTGGLSGTTGSFSGTLQATGGVSVVGTLGTWSIDNQGAVLNFSRASNNYVRAGSTGGALRFDTDGNNAALLLDTNQNATFYGSVSSTYFRVGTTTVIDASSNLTNIGTIASTHFNTSGNVNSTGVSGVSIPSGKRLGFDQSGTRSWTQYAAGGNLLFASGDGNGAIQANNFTGVTLTLSGAIESGTVDVTATTGGTLTIGKAISGHNTSSPARITASSAGQLYLDSTQNQHLYLGWYNGSGYDVLSEMNARFASYKDRNDTAYYVNPAGASLIRNLAIKGTTNDSSTDALVVRDSLNATLLRVRNDGVVTIDDNYLYVTASQGAYFSGSIKARGGIYNDQADLLLNDNVEVSGYTNMTGQLSFTANNTAIRMRDSAGAYTRTMILNGSNVMYIGPVDAYAGGSILYGASSNVSGQTFYVGGNARLAVTGSGITVTGTITGDITGALTGTATQASNLNNHNTGNLSEGSNLYYTNARVGSYLSSNGYDTSSNIIAAITDSAPVLLDTLNELASALGDNENYASDTATLIGLKAPLANPSLTGNTSIAGNLMMTSGTSHIELGSYLKLYGATGSNTAAIAVNANYDGGSTNTWTPDYSGVSGAGMFVLRQIGGGYGTMQVYQKKHGTTGGSHAISTFTKTAEFNDDGYFYGKNLRSEIYYDISNTSRFADPAGLSVFHSLSVNDSSLTVWEDTHLANSGNGRGVFVRYNNTNSYRGYFDWRTLQLGNNGSNKILFGNTSTGGYGQFYVNATAISQLGGSSGTLAMTMAQSGQISSHVDHRAPIFYDIDDTDYYTNPAGTSKMSAIQLGADASPTLTGDSTYLKIATVHGYVEIGAGNGTYCHITTDRALFYFNKPLIVDTGTVRSYDEDLNLNRAGSTTARLRITSGTTISDQPLTVTGNVQHQGLTMTSGTDIDQIYTVTDALTLSTSWQNTSINSTELATGTYIVQVYVSDFAVGGGHYYEMYSGIMSWYSAGTNATAVDELPLHRAGHAPNAGDFYMRTARNNSGGNNLTVQVRGTTSNSGASNYTFKFRRMI